MEKPISTIAPCVTLPMTPGLTTRKNKVQRWQFILPWNLSQVDPDSGTGDNSEDSPDWIPNADGQGQGSNANRSIDPKTPEDGPKVRSLGGCVFGVILLVFISAGLGYYGWRMFSPSNKRLEGQVGLDSIEVAADPDNMNARIPKGLTPTPTFTASLTPTQTPTPTPTDTPTTTPSPTPVPVFEWNSQVLQPALAVGAFTSLAIDSQGFLHILYFQDNNDVIWYAHNDSGEWVFDFIQGEVGHGFHLSMVLDSQDNPHFAYNNVKSKRMKAYLWYRSLTDLGWNGPFREGDYSILNSDISMDLSPDGLAYFSFQTDYDHSVMVGQFNPAKGFASQKVGDGGEDCRSLPIKIDSQGVQHVCYCSEAGLVYAYGQNQEWGRETVDPSPGAGVYVDLALDGDGTPHLAYYDQDIGVLKYGVRGSDGWQVQVVDADGDVGQYPSLVLDSEGGPHISYYDATNTALKYANLRGSVWSIQSVDNDGNVGMFNSLALDPFTEEPRISYFDASKEDLKIASGYRR